MSRHRDTAAARGISRGPVLSVVAVAVVALLVLGWFQLRDTVDEQGAAAAATCVDGTSTVTVAAETDVAGALTEAARRYSESDPVIRDQCVQVEVTALASATVLASLQTGWDTATLGPRPAGWVAQDSSFTTRLAESAPDQLSGDPTSVAVSPLVLAVPDVLGPVVTAAGLTWGQLPALQGSADGWGRYGQPGWGTFTTALPTGVDGSALTTLAVQAVAADLTGGTTPTADTLAADGVAAALGGLGTGPSPQPVDTAAALASLAVLDEVAGSAFQAVPATEQQVFAAVSSGPGTVSAAVLDGTTPVADYPFAVLAGPEVDDTESRAVAAFEEFVAADAQQQVLSDAGFRTRTGAMPQGSNAVPFAATAAVLPPADTATVDALTSALAAPAVLPRATVLLNVSTSMDGSSGDGTLLSATTAALATRIGALPDEAAVGLATFSRGLGGSTPYVEDVPAAALTDGGAQRAAVLAALDGVSTRSAASQDSSVVTAYADAVQGYSPGAANRVLVITDGPNANGGTNEAGVLEALAATDDPDRPVRLDVITLGGADVGALTALAEATGGTVRDVGAPGSADMAQALAELLP